MLLVKGDWEVLYRNAAATRILGSRQGISIRAGKLTLHEETDRTFLVQLQARLAGSTDELQATATRFGRGVGNKEWYCVAAPIKSDASDSQCILLHLVGRTRTRRVPARALRQLFGLTHRETTILGYLLRSRSLRDIAAALSLSHETIRTYLKRIYRKCEVNSQAELQALLHKLSLFT